MLRLNVRFPPIADTGEDAQCRFMISRRTMFTLVGVTAGLLSTSPVAAEDLGGIGPAILAAGFDPATFFKVDGGRDPSAIRIVYSDQYRRPIYSIAFQEGCLKEETRSEVCRTRLTARMVRAPAPYPRANARERSLQLARGLVRRRATSRAAISSALPAMRLEWMQADVRTCPGALKGLSQASALAWLPRAIDQPRSPDGRRSWRAG